VRLNVEDKNAREVVREEATYNFCRYSPSAAVPHQILLSSGSRNCYISHCMKAINKRLVSVISILFCLSAVAAHSETNLGKLRSKDRIVASWIKDSNKSYRVEVKNWNIHAMNYTCTINAQRHDSILQPKQKESFSVANSMKPDVRILSVTYNSR
jgi:hypothetical protein